jgi:hypothetical protein
MTGWGDGHFWRFLIREAPGLKLTAPARSGPPQSSPASGPAPQAEPATQTAG